MLVWPWNPNFSKLALICTFRPTDPQIETINQFKLNVFFSGSWSWFCGICTLLRVKEKLRIKSIFNYYSSFLLLIRHLFLITESLLSLRQFLISFALVCSNVATKFHLIYFSDRRIQNNSFITEHQVSQNSQSRWG